MKHIASLIFCLLLVSCADTPTQSGPFRTGDEVTPPRGCVEMRQRDPKADC